MIHIQKLIGNEEVGVIHHKGEIKHNDAYVVNVLAFGNKQKEQGKQDEGNPSHHEEVDDRI